MPPLSTVTRNGEIIRQIPSIFPKLIVFSGQTARLVEGEEAEIASWRYQARKTDGECQGEARRDQANKTEQKHI